MDSIKAAYYLLAFAESKGDLLTHKKLQKLLYYVQAWHLVYFDADPLFPEQPEAWQHGPVYPTVYQRFKDKSYSTISLEDMYQELGLANSTKYLAHLTQEAAINSSQEKLIEAVMLKYGAMSSFELEVLSHRENPWLEQRAGYEEFERCSNTIPHASMLSFYRGLLDRQKAN